MINHTFSKMGMSLIVILVLFGLSCDPTAPSSTHAGNDHENLKEMAGQMIMVGFRGMEAGEVSPKILEQIDSGYVGGIVLFDYDVQSKAFKRNIESPEQVKSLIVAVQSHARVPLLVAIDQEGGKVNRLKPGYGFPATVSAKYLGALDNVDSTKHYSLLTAQTLKGLGFNVNFAPVVDIDLNPDNPVIGKYERSFSANPETVIKHAAAWIDMHDSLGILSTLKHFPGHGSSAADSHEGFTDVTTYWQEEELIPFREVSKADHSIAIMTAHVFNRQLDSVYPATLSEKTITGVLRDQWKFDGIIFSDDLQMKAVNDLYSFEDLLKLSIEAGVDILVFGNNLAFDENIPRKAVETIVKLVEDGTVSYDRIKTSYDRIMKEKMRDGK